MWITYIDSRKNVIFHETIIGVPYKVEFFVDGLLQHYWGYNVHHRAGESQQNLLNISLLSEFFFFKIAHKERMTDIVVSLLVTEGHQVDDQEDDGCEGPGTVDQLKQISTQTQSLSVARILEITRNNIPPSLPLTPLPRLLLQNPRKDTNKLHQ